MDISSDYRDLFSALNRHKVHYLVIGAYAVTYYAEPRFTKDIDIWVGNDGKNARRLYDALLEFGAPLRGVEVSDFTDKRTIYQIGVAPVRIDIFSGQKGLEFQRAWKTRKKTLYGGVPIAIVGIKELMYMKKRINRDQDALDLKNLRRKARAKK